MTNQPPFFLRSTLFSSAVVYVGAAALVASVLSQTMVNKAGPAAETYNQNPPAFECELKEKTPLNLGDSLVGYGLTFECDFRGQSDEQAMGEDISSIVLSKKGELLLAPYQKPWRMGYVLGTDGFDQNQLNQLAVGSRYALEARRGENGKHVPIFPKVIQ